MRRGRTKETPVPVRQSSRVRGIPAPSPTAEAVVASNRHDSSEDEIQQEHPEADLTAPFSQPEELHLPAADQQFQEVLQGRGTLPLERDLASSQNFEADLEALSLPGDLTYSEQDGLTDASFTSAPDSDGLDIGDHTVVQGNTAEPTMAAARYETLKQTFDTTFTRCQGYAKKLPVEADNVSEAKKILPTLQGILGEIKGLTPDVSLPSVSQTDKKLAEDIDVFLVEVQESIDELTKEVNALTITPPRTGDKTLSGIAMVWRNSIKSKVEAGIALLNTVHDSIKQETGKVVPARAVYYRQKLDDQKKLLDQDIPAAVSRIEEKVVDTFDEHEYTELLGFEDKLKAVYDQVLNSLTLADLSSEPIPKTSTPNNSVLQSPNITQNTAATGASTTATRGRGYKPYRDGDYPKFNGDYEDYWSWKAEWERWIIPEQDFNWVLRNMNRCTPKADDLRICETMEDVWHLLDRKYANSLVVSNEVLDGFLALKPFDIPGRNEECKLLQP